MHDLRRGCAHRLINASVSAETLKVVLRHEDFKTTERFYGAVRAAQSGAAEVHQKLVAVLAPNDSDADAQQLNPDEVRKLRALLNSL